MKRMGRLTILGGCYCICMVIVIILSMAGSAGCQTIPESRIFRSAWQNAGCPANIIEHNGYADVKSFGATGDGIANDQPAVAAAIASLAGTPGVVFSLREHTFFNRRSVFLQASSCAGKARRTQLCALIL